MEAQPSFWPSSDWESDAANVSRPSIHLGGGSSVSPPQMSRPRRTCEYNSSRQHCRLWRNPGLRTGCPAAVTRNKGLQHMSTFWRVPRLHAPSRTPFNNMILANTPQTRCQCKGPSVNKENTDIRTGTSIWIDLLIQYCSGTPSRGTVWKHVIDLHHFLQDGMS